MNDPSKLPRRARKQRGIFAPFSLSVQPTTSRFFKWIAIAREEPSPADQLFGRMVTVQQPGPVPIFRETPQA